MKVAYKDFCKQRQVTENFSIGVNKVVLSDRVSCNKGKDYRYIVDYQEDSETIITIFVKTSKKSLSMEYLNSTRTHPTQ